MQENGGIDGLRRALARGLFAGQNKALASAWLIVHDKRLEELAASEERLLLERSVEAAVSSAASAQKSARWAMWAVVVALLAICVSIISQLNHQ